MAFVVGMRFRFWAAMWCLGFWLVNPLSAELSRPNIIFIVVDDLGYGEPGCYGGAIQTPHLDSLARDGVRFTDGYVTAPFCAASRAALMTGRYQTRFGFEYNPIGAQNSDPDIGLPESVATLPGALRNSGYVTALIGKWHLGGTAKYHPLRRGFDEFFGFLHEGHFYVPPPWRNHTTWLRKRTLPDGATGRWTSPDGGVVWSTHMGGHEPSYDADNPLLRNSQPVDVSDNLTEALATEAERFIVRHKSQPFFLCLALNAPHSPIQAPNVLVNQLGHISDIHRRLFVAMVMHLDTQIGNVLNCLKNESLDRKSLVVFLSDNGGPTRELTSRNHPLSGEKGELREGGIRVPMIMRWTGTLPAGKVERRMISSLDLTATAAKLAGAKLDQSLDGVDLIPFLVEGNTSAIREHHYWRVGGQAAYRSGDWKLFRAKADDPWKLFRLSSDVREEHDLSGSETERLASLVAGWKQLDAEMSPPLWGPRQKKQTLLK